MAEPTEPPSGLIDAVLSEARHFCGLSLPDRRICVLRLIEVCATWKVELSAEIFDIVYGDRTGAVYWAGWLADDISKLYEFVRFLEAHRGRTEDIDRITRSPVLEALSIASRAKPSWLENTDGEEFLGTSYHPQHLAHWNVCRGAAVRWLQQHPEYSELLPRELSIKASEDASQEASQKSFGRSTGQKLMCEEAFRRLYPEGIPDKGHKPSKVLLREVESFIRQSGRVPPHEDTILRYAGRKGSRAGA